MLLLDAPLTLREFVTHEEVPLAAVFREVLQFLVGRTDVAVFGAHAVNAYCEPERMTQDVDLLSTRAADLADELRATLTQKLRIAARVREVVPARGYRVYQLRSSANRHLVDVRQVDALPPTQTFGGVCVTAPADLIAMKLISLVHRAGQPKAGTDLVDVQRLLLAFPALQDVGGAVSERLQHMNAGEPVVGRWRELAASTIVPDVDDGY